ncbi:hypothetical protein B0A69_02195 [Chryseobacterium shigense]|uniref:Curlin associated repeat-containing protein n=1 Tax=Chryseobacterium shigense TaxID=297244 RepID=A0A1N7I9A8_9FLAO|nr:hypothetical protein [Chryseobacterium shigense]PQA96898.1 hypothetical protein B0A69_02195 [Chryseobacterium shigense]SIS33651.1 hypothetical protein SAMN05421639_102694 [Chryseobacterium shigense]
MLKLRWGAFTLFAVLLVHAQQIDWDRVNSSTVLDLLSKQQTEQGLYGSNIIQIGNQNNAELSLNAKTNIAVQQLGDYNTLYFMNSFTDKESKTTISTQGNNNIIDITGSNTVSDGMQISVKGDNKTIFMRNY